MSLTINVDAMRVMVCEERNKKIHQDLLTILADPSPRQREIATTCYLARLSMSKMEYDSKQAIPFETACREGEINIWEKYLIFKAEVNKERVFESLNACKQASGHAKAKKISSIKKLTKNLINYKREGLPKSFLAVSTEDALLISTHLSNADIWALPNAVRRDKAHHGTRHTLIVDKVKNVAVILFKRSESRLCGGSEKIGYACLIANLQDCTVKPAIQHVPFRKPIFNPSTRLASGFAGKRGFLPFEWCFQYKSDGFLKEKLIQPYQPHELSQDPWTQLSLSEQMNVILDIAYALGSLHEAGVVHQDLRQDNLLMNGHRGYLIDFGLSHRVSEQCIITRDQAFYGIYTSPEQIRQVWMRNGAGKPGDMYALGGILYGLTFGEMEWIPLIEELWTTINKDPADNLLDERPALQALRSQILEKQSQVIGKLEALQTNPWRTSEEDFHLLVYQMLHPQVDKRLTARQLVDALEELQAKINSLDSSVDK